MKPLLALLLAAGIAAPHDLEENRATLVLREGTHISLTLYLNYSQALHQALSPQAEFGAFLLTYSSLKTADLAKELARAQVRFESEVRIQAGESTLRLTGWNWPDAKTVQTLLQQQVMQTMVEGHAHQTPVEVRAEAVSSREITAVTVRLPKEFNKVLIVSYRPRQVWLDPAAPSQEIRF